MNLRKEVKRRFPKDKIRYVGRATIKPLFKHEEGERPRLSIPVRGSLVVTDKHIIFSVDRGHYHLLMGLVGLLFLAALLILLMGGLSSLPCALLLIIVFVGTEGFLFLESSKFSFMFFGRDESTLSAEKELSRIRISGRMEGDVRWIHQEGEFMIEITDKRFPKL